MEWLNAGKKRFIYQEFIAGTGGDIFSNLAGSTSKGTIGVGKHNKNKKQIRPKAGGINLPNKTMISSIQHYAKKYPEKPVLENYIQTQLLIAIGSTKPESENEYWSFFDELNDCHTIWASNHPGGNSHINKEGSYYDIWKHATNNLGWDFFPIAPIINSREIYSWACCIMNHEHSHRPIDAVCANIHNVIEYWQNKLPSNVFKFNHVDLIIQDKKKELLELCHYVNTDIDTDVFNVMYDNYRELRMPIYNEFEKQHGSAVDKFYNSVIIKE
tara:strand:+ start:10714 stop:11526 length:813 start_codon:yes stop_codon:yes gene_type:complete